MTTLASETVTATLGKPTPGSSEYKLKRGDFAHLPSLDWTCFVGTLPASGRKPAFFCATDDKPVVSLWFSAHRVVVGNVRRPTRVEHGYSFTVPSPRR